MLVLDRAQVESLLDTDALIAALAPAMVELSAGRVSMPPRTAALVQGKGLLGTMPAYLPTTQTLSCKLVSVFPGNGARDLPTHQAVVLLFDAASGVPLAMLDGASITARRTAAGSALATRLLARQDAEVLLIIGTGVQARAHAQAVTRVCKIRELHVAGRDPRKTAGFARSVAAELGLPGRSFAIGGEAFAGADIVCATTHAEEPVVRGEWLAPGMHVNSVGLNAQGREVDAAAVSRALVVVESRQSALAPPPAGAPDLASATVHAEVGELIAGIHPGRTNRTQVTLYKSVGVAVQDAVAARLAYDAALQSGVGLKVTL